MHIYTHTDIHTDIYRYMQKNIKHGARWFSQSDWDPARAEGAERCVRPGPRLVQAGT